MNNHLKGLDPLQIELCQTPWIAKLLVVRRALQMNGELRWLLDEKGSFGIVALHLRPRHIQTILKRNIP